jgi:predicted NBD/HSP70 family sugar kinase
MNYVGLDIHTKNVVYTVLSEDGNVIRRDKIENNV